MFKLGIASPIVNGVTMKSLNALWLNVLVEYGDMCHVSTTQDRKTFLRRVENEGMEFLTISLPQFGKEFERALDLGGSHDPELWEGWKRNVTPSGSRVYMPNIRMYAETSSPTRTNPLFLGGFLGRIFDTVSGVLLNEPDIDAIIAVRQLSAMFGKLLVPCSDARVEKAIAGYIECEQEIRRNDADLERLTLPQEDKSMLEKFQQASSVMFGAVLQQIDEDIYYGSITPKHGPGATADRLTGNRKYDQIQWTTRLEQVFPFGENALPNWRYHSAYSRVEFLEPGAERPVRVITVPKTAKTPRIIAIEPTCMQYMQQGLMAKFVEYLESKKIGPHRGNRNHGFGYVGFTDQLPNQQLAREGSLHGELATLDLSEASDRVSWMLVKALLSRYPNLQEGVAATRSRRAQVPGHGVIRLAKFASMGSALTFPMEAIIFSTVVMMGIASSLSTSVTPELCEEYRHKVRVYGDDIIVPVDHVQAVVSHLELFGFKVNNSKSFWTGKFRESCGREFYAGEDVSIVRARRMFPTQLRQVEEVMSLVSLRNQLYNAGLWKTTAFLDVRLETLFRGHYPVVASSSPVLGRESVSFGYEAERIHPHLHSPQVKGYAANVRKARSELNGIGALVKCLLNREEVQDTDLTWSAALDKPIFDSKHLHFGGRPQSIDIKLRWGSPF